jgi:hypothetical protein
MYDTNEIMPSLNSLLEKFNFCDISVYRGCDYREYCLLGYDAI